MSRSRPSGALVRIEAQQCLPGNDPAGLAVSLAGSASAASQVSEDDARVSVGNRLALELSQTEFCAGVRFVGAPSRRCGRADSAEFDHMTL